MIPLTISVGSNASKTGSVEAFQADLICTNGSVSSISTTAGPYTWEIDIDVMGDGCTAKFTSTPAETSDTDEFQLLSFGNTVLEQCPGTDQTTLFVLFGRLNISSLRDQNHMKYSVINSFDHTVMVCTPTHALHEALVTTDSAGNLRGVEVQRTLDRMITLPSDLLKAFNTSIQAAAPTFLGDPSPANITTEVSPTMAFLRYSLQPGPDSQQNIFNMTHSCKIHDAFTRQLQVKLRIDS
jgi:hypothetical protein